MMYQALSSDASSFGEDDLWTKQTDLDRIVRAARELSNKEGLMAHLPRIEEPYGLNIRRARGREVLSSPFWSPTNTFPTQERIGGGNDVSIARAARAEQLSRAVERELNPGQFITMPIENISSGRRVGGRTFRAHDSKPSSRPNFSSSVSDLILPSKNARSAFKEILQNKNPNVMTVVGDDFKVATKPHELDLDTPEKNRKTMVQFDVDGKQSTFDRAMLDTLRHMTYPSKDSQHSDTTLRIGDNLPLVMEGQMAGSDEDIVNWFAALAPRIKGDN